MGIISRTVNNFFEKRLTPSRSGLVALGNFGGLSSAAGVAVNGHNAMGYPAFYACVRVIAEDVAQLPLKFYERIPGGGKRELRDDPRFALLHDEANPEMTAYELRIMLISQLCSGGNGYAEIEWDDSGYPVALWPLLPDPGDTDLTRVEGELFYVTRVPGESVRRALPAWRVLHLRDLMGSNGLTGKSRLLQHRESIGFGLATQEFGANYFANGARPGGVLEHPGKLSPEAHRRLKVSFEEDHGGLSNAHRLKILEEGMKYAPVGVPPEEAQFLQSRTFQLGEMARIFRVQPHMVGDLSKSTNNNIEQQSLEHVIYTLQPWLVSIEQSLRRVLLLPREKSTLSFEHAVDGLLRGNFEARYAGYAIGRQWGWLSVNDILQLENMNPVAGGDTRLSPLNMTELGQKGMTRGQDDRMTGDILPLHPPVQPRVERRAAVDVASRRRRLVDAQVPPLEDVAGRVVRRESADVGRAVNKFLRKGNDLAGFVSWLEEFYAEHMGFVSRNFAPALESVALLVLDAVADEVGGEISEERRRQVLEFVGQYADALGVRWSLSSKGQLVALAAEEDAADAIDGRLADWEETEPGKAGRREAGQSVNALARAAYIAFAIRELVWRAGGSESCPYCQSLDGKVVGIDEAFLGAGDFQPDGAAGALKVRRNTFHPPVHEGCSCVVTS